MYIVGSKNNHYFMSKAEPIKTDLMKFVTLRSPQLINQKIRNQGFIRHIDPIKSKFLKRIPDVTDVELSRVEVRKALNGFESIAAYEDLIQMNISLYEFSEWLALEQNSLKLDVCKEKANGVFLLTKTQLIKVWDNLFYQIVVRESDVMRQAALRMIIAHNFIEKLNDADIEATAASVITGPKNPEPPQGDELMTLYLNRIAVSKIVIPKAFSVGKEKINLTNNSLFPDFKNIQRKHEQGISRKRVKTLEEAELDINVLKKKYKSDRKKAFNKAEREHHKKILSLKRPSDSEEKGALEVGRTIGLLRLGGDAERASTGSSESTMTSANAKKEKPNPPFNFKFEKPFSEGYKKSLSKNTQRVFDQLKINVNGIDQAKDTIRRKILAENSIINDRIKGSKKIIKMRGGSLSEPKDVLYEYSITITKDELADELSKKIVMTFESGYKQSYPSSVNLVLKFQAGNEYVTNDVEILDNTHKHILLDLFPKHEIESGKANSFTIKGELRLDNGNTILLDVNGRVNNKSTNGIGQLLEEVEENEVHLYGVNKVGVADFRKVEQEVCCYVPGEVSHIENVMAREYKERHTRTFIGTETTTEETSSYEQENTSDTTSTSRNELQSEVQNVLSASLNTSIGAGAGVSGSFPSGSYNANASFNLGMSSSLSKSNREAKTMAQEVTEKALERVVRSTSQKRVFKMMREFEENNRHGFDNREGDKHVTGVYRWVDKVYTNRLINYGKRLMYEFMVPEPARFYKKAIENKQEENPLINVLEKPKHPTELHPPLNSSSDITYKNYKAFGAAYGAQLEAPKPLTETVSQSITPMTPPDHKPFSGGQDIYLPEGYRAEKADGSLSFVYKYSSGDGPGFRLSVGGDQIPKDPPKTGLNKDTYSDDTIAFDFGKFITEKVAVSVSGNKIFSYTINITVDCELKPKIIHEWQSKVYDSIMAAFNEKMVAYENSQITAEIVKDVDEQNLTSNSGFNREIELRELKRSCIEMITQPFEIPMGKNFYRKGEHDIPRIKQTKEFETYASHVKFFEQAFEWDIMAYLFYPYYWAKKKQWLDLFQLEDIADPIFQAFLQSGMSRVVVPVRPGFEEAVSYYMETGDIWNGGGLVLDSDDDLYLSIAEEMEMVEGVVEDVWQTRVPSTLTVIQNDSVGLDATGLPCCDAIEGEGFEGSNETLSRITTSTDG